MTHVEDLLLEMLGQQGKRYVFGAEAGRSRTSPEAFDCSELIEWAAARTGVNPRVPDGSRFQWAHVEQHGLEIPLDQAEVTRGALLFRAPTASAPGHVAVALGDGTTIEARGSAWGVGVFRSHNRFERGGLFPGVDYELRDPFWPHERGFDPPVGNDVPEPTLDALCVPTWGPDTARGWTYRLTIGGTRPHVVAYNGAPLNRGFQRGIGLVWHVTDVPELGIHLAVAAVDMVDALAVEQFGDRIVVVCADGGWIDVARRP